MEVGTPTPGGGGGSEEGGGGGAFSLQPAKESSTALNKVVMIGFRFMLTPEFFLGL